MNIYYKRFQTWQKWPDNDIIDTDVVKFSTSKKRFNSNIFLELEPIKFNQEERLALVALHLKQKSKNINLYKL